MVSSKRRGAASATAFAGVDAGEMLGPVLAGFIIALTSYETMFRLAIIPVILCAAIMTVWFRRNPALRAPVRAAVPAAQPADEAEV
jgi:MFS family permease